MPNKTFTLAEAKKLLPQLKNMLLEANQEITKNALALAEAYTTHENCEEAMSKIKATKVTTGDSNKGDDLADLRICRLNFQSSIELLSKAKTNYTEALDYWLEEISYTGVILRNIQSGLLDFPACTDNFEYYLCWQGNEHDIQYWHMIDDGYTGRRPLTVLSEYI